MSDSVVSSSSSKTDENKSEWEGIIMEAIATMIYVFVCCGVVASTANVTFDELNSPRLVVISLARKFICRKHTRLKFPSVCFHIIVSLC